MCIRDRCMAGGVALNCVANGKIERAKIFKNIFIQPASGDAGGALGAAPVSYTHLDVYKRQMPYQFDLKVYFDNQELKLSLIHI